MDIIGHYAEILPTAKYFVDGIGVPSWLRSQKLFVERVNANGTVVLAYDQSMMTAGCLYRHDVHVDKEVRTYHDEFDEDTDISIRIMGVEKRMDNINITKTRFHVPDEHVFIDREHIGCVENAKRAWLAETDKPFVMVVQDDVEFCDDFIHYANKVVKQYKDKIITFFPFQFFEVPQGGLPKKSPYVLTRCISGQATLMPTEYVKPCISAWREDIKGDDTNIMRWGWDNDIKFLTTLPALTQHLGQESVFDHTRSIGKSNCYRKNPGKYADFDNGYLNHWTNLVSD